ncbi:hypothetical protein PG984_015041 [Apiospora sp. TS-2023a]
MAPTLRNSLAQVHPDQFDDCDNERLALIEEAKKLISRLQTKEERIYDLTFTQPIVFAALQTCLDVGLWSGWSEAGGEATSVGDLCKLCQHDVEPNLLRRLLRLLASVYLIEETGPDEFRLTPFSLCFGRRSTFIPQTIQASTLQWQNTCLNLPKYLAKTGYREPQDAKSTNYCDWCTEGLDFFSKCMAEPAYQDAFSGFMKSWALYKRPWPEFFDTDSLLAGADLESAPLCVDVGGHHGIDLGRLLGKYPDLPAGSLVLQDLPEVVAEARGVVSDKITVMEYNMLDAQPVKGARAYYFHAVFHDWPDKTAVQMLRNTVGAMRKGYSRVLINDIALPATGASWAQTTMDVNMMAILSAYERSDAMWTELLTNAGLRVVKIWRDGRGNESLIEAELA